MTEDNNEVKDNNGILSFMIALVLVFALIAFLIFNFNNTNREFSKDDNKDKTKLALDKYSSISSKRDVLTNELIFFRDSKVDINNIEADKVLYVAYSNLSTEDRVVKGSVSEECYFSDSVNASNYPNDCFIEVIDKGLLEEQIRNYFSSKVNISYNNFAISSNQICYLEGNIYNCYLDKSTPDMINYNPISKYDSYEIDGDNLIVYSYLLTIRDAYDKTYETGIYSDSKATNKIDDLTYYENELNKIITQDTIAKLIDNYKDKISKYKTVFVKDNNNYVWYSTELIK